MKRVLNVGGNSHEILLPVIYDGWQRVLLDIDPACNPDVVCDARNLTALASAEYDSVYCSHNLEHYFRHDVYKVLAGFMHVLKDDGFIFIRVPDIAQVMKTVVQENLDIDDVLYQSPAGPIAVRDVVYGLDAEIERSGNDFFAHKTGFSQQSLISILRKSGFPVTFSRCDNLEITVFAFKSEPSRYLAKLLDLPGSVDEDDGVSIPGNRAGATKISAGHARNARSGNLLLMTADGILVSVPASLDCITTYVLLEQERWFEREADFVLRWLKPGMNAVDVGANVGVFSLPLARRVGPAGKVFAFEPGTGNRRHLEVGRTENSLENLFISACALSDSEKAGWLEIESSGELNSLTEGTSATSENAERVRVSSLDIQTQECAWPSIDFLKIDAEGQEARIVAGGRDFFRAQSPLVMYEIKSGVSHNHNLRWIFQTLGYATYRLLGDASCLVPLGSDDALDSYELNLFAAKPDRAAGIACDGLLVAEPADYFLSEEERKTALASMIDLPYARSFEFSQQDIHRCAYGDALVAYAAYRFVELSPGRRYAALSAAFEFLRTYCETTPTPSGFASLVRVALDLGHRQIAVETLTQLLGMEGAQIEQPFFPPCPRYEGLPVEGREADWFSAAAIEQMEISQAYSSKFVDKGLDRLQALCVSPFASAEISRRAVLRSARGGMGLRDLVGYLNPDHQHQNSSYWLPSQLSTILSLL
jgi:FkbM family methyltransferase